MVSVELAELAGLFAAEGNMQEKHLSIWGHRTEDRDYYDNTVSMLFKSEFGFLPRCHEKRSNGVYGFYICRKEIINRFRELGFKVGSKTYTVRIPTEIMRSTDLKVKAGFVRGLFDGDGCLHFLRRTGKYCQFKRSFHTYPRIIISSRSFGLIDDAKKLLDELEVRATMTIHNPSYSWESPAKILNVRGEGMLKRWMEKIGISNIAHRSKYLLWKKQGHCPTRTLVAERVQLLAK